MPKEPGRGSLTPPRVSAGPPQRPSRNASPSPEPPPSTSPSPQDVLAGLPMGRVLFACPPLMKVATSERVEVRISGNPKENLVAGLQERGVPIVQPSKIAPVMKVTLTPDEDGVFQVKSLSADEQLMSGDDYSQWVWSVTPLKSGTHNLYLTVNVVVDVPGLGAQEKEIPVLTQAVRVQADAAYSAGQFWSSNWQWFLKHAADSLRRVAVGQAGQIESLNRKGAIACYRKARRVNASETLWRQR